MVSYLCARVETFPDSVVEQPETSWSRQKRRPRKRGKAQSPGDDQK